MAREMKDSGVAWIGEIPVEWEIGKVKRFYKMTTGFTPDTKNQLFYDDNGYDWVNIADIQDGKAIWTTKNKIPDFEDAIKFLKSKDTVVDTHFLTILKFNFEKIK